MQVRVGGNVIECSEEDAALFKDFRGWQDKALAVMIDRHKKYGIGNIAAMGESGVLVRAHDKWARITRGTQAVDESIEDSYIDLANYAVIGAMVRNGQWPEPVKFDNGCPWCGDTHLDMGDDGVWYWTDGRGQMIVIKFCPSCGGTLGKK